ncbi:hypothetical protein BDF20DRAFT_818655 [Mycotypha africana]|uniref:uncharacterized protein n=1 Tax=Mycotypha africana TaxID=64632 RepID=UPI002300135A|nr:uncharacterized protein BDF20DRAFT_818655 [Mycotypha africana]KAI8981906.1 hypothetical protein BDF20DRAFT_818655 [Mycotypha africana]
MSTFSKNLFDVLGDGEAPRPAAPVKEEAPVVIDKKSVTKINKDAARSARSGPKKNGRQQNGRQRGREFDRHSGTGIVDTKKKIEKGWGKAGVSEAEAEKDNTDASPDKEEQTTPVEPEEVVKTLDEYLAEKANKSLKVSLPEARKANDADDAAFKDAVAFVKKEEEDFFVPKETKSAKKSNAEKPRKEKVFVDIEQRFVEKPRSEFRRNDRRNGGRNNNNRRSLKKNAAGPAINLQDASAFPTLGATA